MRFKLLHYCAFILLCLAINGLYAQETISAAGGDATSGSGSVSYTIGQVAYHTNSDATGTVTEGVQQAYEITVPDATEDAEGIELTYAVKPNPAIDFLELKIEGYENYGLSYLLFDMNGSLLELKQITGDITPIDMSHLPPAAYFLKITNNDNIVKTFKIIKN